MLEHVQGRSLTLAHEGFTLAHAGNFRGLAYPRCCEPFSDFPGKDRRILSLALDDGADDSRGEEPGSAPSDGLRLQESSAAVAAQDLADAPVGHLKTRTGIHLLKMTAYKKRCSIY